MIISTRNGTHLQSIEISKPVSRIQGAHSLLLHIDSVPSIMTNEDLPLGYLVTDNILLNYTRNLTDHPMSDKEAKSYALYMALHKANAVNSDAQWAISDSYDLATPEARFLQISRGGKRIPQEVEDRLCAELGLTGGPVRFEPRSS